MGERYTRLFNLSGTIYAPEAPVLITAGALLKDNKTEKILIQVKYKSISAKQIKAMQIRVSSQDTMGKDMGNDFTYQYLDLSVGRDDEFGQTTPVFLPDNQARAFAVQVIKVIYEENSVWDGEHAVWSKLPQLESLEALLNNYALAVQYRKKYGENKQYVPLELDNIWLCSCGCVNYRSESNCHGCGAELSVLKKGLCEEDLEKDLRYDTGFRELQAGSIQEYQKAIVIFDGLGDWRDSETRAAYCRKRIDEIHAEEEQIAREAAEREEQERKRKKRILIGSVIALVALLCAFAVFSIVKKQLELKERYLQAIEYYEAGEYAEAVEVFRTLEDYKDSENRLRDSEEMYVEQQYQKALTYLSDGQAAEALPIFSSLGDYKESLDKTALCEFMTSETYKQIEKVVKSSYDSKVFKSYTFEFDPETERILIRYMHNGTPKYTLHADNMGLEYLWTWGTIESTLTYISESTYEYLVKSGYEYGCVIEWYEGTQLLLAIENGEVGSSLIDYQAAKEAEYEKLYSKVVSLIDSGKYDAAYAEIQRYQPEQSDCITLDYKDLRDCYYYSKALSEYLDSEKVYLNEVLTTLKKVHPEFREAKRYTETVSNLLDSVEGTYELVSYAYGGEDYYRLEINKDSVELYSYLPWESLWKEFPEGKGVHYLEGKIGWKIVDDRIVSAEEEHSIYIYTISPASGGLYVDVSCNENWTMQYQEKGLYKKIN